MERQDALSYLDPPYYGTEKYYSTQFSIEDHLKLREILCTIKGRFILSYNDLILSGTYIGLSLYNGVKRS
jgi:DNA adenine methylase